VITLALRAGLLAAVMLAPAGAGAMQCPQPQRGSQGGVIPETAITLQDLSALLESGDRANRIGVLIHTLQQNYPNARNADIVDYLVTAFCPVVNQLSGLGDAEKQARMDTFTQQVASQLY
jgi:hypothetical protein